VPIMACRIASIAARFATRARMKPDARYDGPRPSARREPVLSLSGELRRAEGDAKSHG
jgi:hypothetical protein